MIRIYTYIHILDVEAVAQDLIRKGYTSTPKLAVIGGSNGGLMVRSLRTNLTKLTIGSFLTQLSKLTNGSTEKVGNITTHTE